jgi:hypothetical protein
VNFWLKRKGGNYKLHTIKKEAPMYENASIKAAPMFGFS